MRQLKQEYQEEVSSAMSDNGIPKDKIFFRYQCPAGVKGTFRNRNQSWIYLTKKSYSRIRNTWLDDEIMNHMLCLISQDLERFPAYKNKNFFFSSHFFPQLSSTKDQNDLESYKQLKKWFKKDNIFKFEKLFIPIHVSKTHWYLIVADMKGKKINVLDSYDSRYKKKNNGKSKDYQSPMKIILQFLSKMHQLQYPDAKKMFDKKKWSLIGLRECTQQLDDHNCGPLTIIHADFVARGFSPFLRLENQDTTMSNAECNGSELCVILACKRLRSYICISSLKTDWGANFLGEEEEDQDISKSPSLLPVPSPSKNGKRDSISEEEKPSPKMTLEDSKIDKDDRMLSKVTENDQFLDTMCDDILQDDMGIWSNNDSYSISRTPISLPQSIEVEGLYSLEDKSESILMQFAETATRSLDQCLDSAEMPPSSILVTQSSPGSPLGTKLFKDDIMSGLYSLLEKDIDGEKKSFTDRVLSHKQNARNIIQLQETCSRDIYSALIFCVPKQLLNDFSLQEGTDIVSVLKMSLVEAQKGASDNNSEDEDFILSSFSKTYQTSIVVDQIMDKGEFRKRISRRNFYRDGTTQVSEKKAEDKEGGKETMDNNILVLHTGGETRKHYLPCSGPWLSEFIIQGELGEKVRKVFFIFFYFGCL